MSVLEIYRSRLDETAWQVFAGALEYSRKQGQNFVFAEHVIRQLFLERRDLVDKILYALSVSPQDFQDTLEQRMNARPQSAELAIRLDVEVIRMLQSALARARSRGRLKISQSDMLLALGRDERGTLPDIFAKMRVDFRDAIAAIEVVAEREKSSESTAASEKFLPFAVGDMIRITTGAFAAMSARVAAVDGEESRLRVNVSVYGRSNTIELRFTDVEKISFD